MRTPTMLLLALAVLGTAGCTRESPNEQGSSSEPFNGRGPADEDTRLDSEAQKKPSQGNANVPDVGGGLESSRDQENAPKRSPNPEVNDQISQPDFQRDHKRTH